MSDKKKVKIPDSVKKLRYSLRKYAKKNDIKLKGKHIPKRERKKIKKRLMEDYSENAITGLNKAVKILTEHPECENNEKIKSGIENIILNPDVVREIAKLYKKHSDQYTNLIYLPNMILNTLSYYENDANLSEEEKKLKTSLDPECLVSFCEKILKKQIKRYMKLGLDSELAYHIATIIPSARLFKINSQWYRKLIKELYDLAGNEKEVNVDEILHAICRIDKEEVISKKAMLREFYSEFILQKCTNKQAKFNQHQKELHEGLIENCLKYLDDLKLGKLRDILRNYIKVRRKAEEFKNDSKRIIKFVDHANSNSPYLNIKKVVQDLIVENPTNEVYLS